MVDILIVGEKQLNRSSAMSERKQHERCAFIRCCYLADELDCFGFKADCVLYQRSNGVMLPEEAFNNAVDDLIDRVRAKAERLVE